MYFKTTGIKCCQFCSSDDINNFYFHYTNIHVNVVNVVRLSKPTTFINMNWMLENLKITQPILE